MRGYSGISAGLARVTAATFHVHAGIPLRYGGPDAGLLPGNLIHAAARLRRSRSDDLNQGGLDG